MEPVTNGVDLDIIANILINVERHIVAPASFFVSRKDNKATAPAITAIADDMTIRFFIQSLAPRVAHIIAVSIVDNKPTTTNPLARLATSIILIRTQTPAIIPIATDIPINVPAIFPASGPAFLTALIIATINAPKATTAAVPFAISLAESIPTSFITPTISAIDIETDKRRPPTFAMELPESILTVFISAFTNSINAAAKVAPFIISSGDNLPTSLTTPTMSVMDIEMDSNNVLSLAISVPRSTLTAFFKPYTNNTNAAANPAPFIISSGDNLPTSLTTPTMSVIAKAILTIIPPNLSTLLPPIVVTLVRAVTKATKPTANATPFFISSEESIPTNLTTSVIRSIAVAILLIIFPALSIF